MEASTRLSDILSEAKKLTKEEQLTLIQRLVVLIKKSEVALNSGFFVVGGTAARTRLYQMAIARYLDRLQTQFTIYGELSNAWEPFQPNRPYTAFFARPKLFMKTASKISTVEAPIITRNPELNQEDNATFSPEKMQKARQIIARAGLPPVKLPAAWDSTEMK